MNDLLRVCVRLRKDPLIEFRLRLLYLIILGKNRKSKQTRLAAAFWGGVSIGDKPETIGIFQQRERREHIGIQRNGSLAPDCWWNLLV